MLVVDRNDLPLGFHLESANTAEVRVQYSPVGYRMVIRGYDTYVNQPGLDLGAHLPDVSEYSASALVLLALATWPA